MKGLVLFLLVFVCPAMAQNIYKVIDEDGNVIYTDQPPSSDAEPEDLPMLGQMDAGRSQPRRLDRNDSNGEVTAAYPELAIVQPEHEENLWGTGGSVSVTIDPGKELGVGHQLVLLLDGAEVARGAAQRIRIDEVVRGQHTLSSMIVDEAGNEVARAPSIIFHMKQATGG